MLYRRRALENMSLNIEKSNNNSCTFRQFRCVIKSSLIVEKIKEFQLEDPSTDKKLSIFTFDGRSRANNNGKT